MKDLEGEKANPVTLALLNQPQRRKDSVDLQKKQKTTSTNKPIKSALRHWRSPSNPVDWSKSAWSVNRSLIGADELEASQPTTSQARKYSSNSNREMRMTNIYLEQSDILSVIGSTPSLPNTLTQLQNNPIAGQKAYLPSTTHRPSPLGRHNFTADDLLHSQPEQETKFMTFPERSTTPIPQRVKSPVNIKLRRRSSQEWRQSYELTLIKCPSLISHGQERFPLLAELTLSPVVSVVSASDFSSTRRFAFAFEATYCGQPADFHGFAATSLGFGCIDPFSSDLIFARNAQRFASRANLNLTSAGQAAQKLSFSRTSLLQVILRNPQDGAVADIFVLRLDLSDMPANSRTILRQKVYRSTGEEVSESKSSSSSSYLAKVIEIPLVRSSDADSKRQKIKLSGPIRVAFSFNRSNLRFTSKANAAGVERAQKTTTLLQFPVDQKYFSLQTLPHPLDTLKRASSLTAAPSERSSQHGSLCL